jgi:hypothetical protein
LSHSTLGQTPFEVLYAHAPRHLGITNPGDFIVPNLTHQLETMLFADITHSTTTILSSGSHETAS